MGASNQKTYGRIEYEAMEPEDFAKLLVDIESHFGGSSAHSIAFDGLVDDRIAGLSQIERLTRELEIAHSHHPMDVWRVTLNRVSQERDRLRAALDQYGDHTYRCPARHSEGKCDCGWEAIAGSPSETHSPTLSEMTLRELQAELGRVQFEIHNRVAGSQTTGIGLPTETKAYCQCGTAQIPYSVSHCHACKRPIKLETSGDQGCACDVDDPFKCREQRPGDGGACHCVCHGL